MGVMIGGLVFGWLTNDYWKFTAVGHGYAHYDAKTAAFTWNNEVKP